MTTKNTLLTNTQSFSGHQFFSAIPTNTLKGTKKQRDSETPDSLVDSARTFEHVGVIVHVCTCNAQHIYRIHQSVHDSKPATRQELPSQGHVLCELNPTMSYLSMTCHSKSVTSRLALEEVAYLLSLPTTTCPLDAANASSPNLQIGRNR